MRPADTPAPRRWPKASATLLDFLEPLGLDQMPLEAVRHVATVGSTIWCAVVLADLVGDPASLDETRRAMEASGPPGPAIFRMLVDRKRKRFGDDPRLLVVDDVRWDGVQARIEVLSSLPAGLEDHGSPSRYDRWE